MRIAFHAPLKSPDHPVPSGDRQIARAFLRALEGAGHEAFVASRYRTFDGAGDPVRQARLARIGERLARRLIARWRDGCAPDAWFTYHLYHKAPDVIGPVVSRALGIPYVVAEASISPRQHDGGWRAGHARVVDAVRAADAIVCLNPRDMPCVRQARGHDAGVTLLAPFIDVAAFANGAAACPRPAAPDGAVRLLTVAMMRDGAKLASYRTLAAALARVSAANWSLRIVGDGPARADVERAFGDLAHRVRFVGARSAPAIAALLHDSDLFVWPAIHEAIGIVFLEAQACGVAVVGGDSAGVAAVVDRDTTGLLTPEGDVDAFAAAIGRLLADAPLRGRMGAAAAGYVRRHHDVGAAGVTLDATLRDAVSRRRLRGAA